MHLSAYQFVEESVAKLGNGYNTVVEVGSQDVNGSVKPLFERCHYTGMDLTEGPNVDVVHDATIWPWPDECVGVSLVVCTNVLEHVEFWQAIVSNCYEALAPGGWLILQAAGRGFQVHSGRRESLQLDPGEWYANIEEDDLYNCLHAVGFRHITVRGPRGWPEDVCAVAQRPTYS